MFSVSPHYFQHIFHCCSNPWTHHSSRETCLDRMEIFCADLPFPGEQVRNQVYLILIVTPMKSPLSQRSDIETFYKTQSKDFLPCLSLRNLSWSLVTWPSEALACDWNTTPDISPENYCFFFDKREKYVPSYKTMGKIILGFIMPLTHK